MPNYSGVWALQQQYQSRGQNIWPSIPGAPTSPVATPGNTLASVAFVAPSNAGYPAITSYRVISSPGGIIGTGATSPVTVSGLTNGTAYTFTVTAQNAAGYGPESVASNSVTPAVPNYIEEVFSTYLYTGTGAALTITNNIDLSANGGMVWVKRRNTTGSNRLYDTVRDNVISSDSTAIQGNAGGTYFAGVSSSGFTLGTNTDVNASSSTYDSWTFREKIKFFDVVTWTGNGLSSQTIPHSLGSDPGCIINKATSAVQNWWVYHRSTGTGNYLVLNTTAAQVAGTIVSATSSTDFTVGSTLTSAGVTYVAYLFSHDAGGFGTTGNDNVVSCGTFTTDASGGATVTLGYEPQWVLVKRSNGVENWTIVDSMRGIGLSNGAYPATGIGLNPNLTSAESNANILGLNATGFTTGQSITGSATYIYIAVRRGPMKVPTLGTTVFGISARTGTSANATVTGGSGVDDGVLIKNRGAAVADLFASRLTGNRYMITSSTASEVTASGLILQANTWDVMDGVKVGTTSTITNASANTFVNYLFSRAPGFFDVINYGGTGTVTTVSHNLQAVPELLIFKKRDVARSWAVVHANAINRTISQPPVYTGYDVSFDLGVSGGLGGVLNSTAPTSSVVTLSSSQDVNGSGNTYVAWLFSTVAGVSKIGSYTGTAALQTVACGFAAGARFLLIKRSDADGDWYYWDSVRGLSSGNDPYLLLNTAAAEVTATNYVDTDTTGFKVTAAAPAALNAVGGTYIFLAIA